MKTTTEEITQNYTAGDRLTLHDAAALFACRDKRPHELPRTRIDRWRHRIKTAVKKRLLAPVSDTYEICELVSWAMKLKVKGQENWALTLRDLPHKMPGEEVKSQNSTASEIVMDTRLPAKVEHCHDEIRRLEHEKITLRQKLAELQKEVDHLRPKAERYDRNCEKNRKSGGWKKNK